MPAILSISSQVLRGHVGNSAAAPTFNALGFEAWAVPTVILSNHPGHGSAAGFAVAASDMEAMIRELERHGWLQDCVGILTGYFRSPEQCMFASQLVHELKHTNPDIFYCCDPVIGDDPQGLYVDTDIALAVRDRLVPQADLLTPNLFELQWLSGVHARAPEEVAGAAQALNCAEVMATSIPAGDDKLVTVWVEGEAGVQAVVGRRADVPHGVGDMMAAAALACRLSGDDPAHALGRACGLIEHVLDVSQGRDELDLTAGLRDAATVPSVWVRPVGADEHDFAGTGWVAGVDGCPAGWIVALVDADDPGNARCELCRDFTDILMLEPRPEIIAVDIPIGVPDIALRGGRTCDNETRSRLGGRQSSVFSVPSRAALAETDYARACAVNLEHSEPPRKVSKQCFGLFPKMREVDRIMTPGLQDRVFEVHPELAFWSLNGCRALDLPKKVRNRPDAAGLDLRKNLLAAAGFPMMALETAEWPKSQVGPDDVIDAFALAWSARRLLAGEAVTLPPDPPRDGRGLRMEINA